MSAAQVRETLQQYVEVLLARGDYGRFFDDDIEFALMGTDQQSRGAQAAEQTIRFLHETAFDAEPEIANLVVDDHGAAAEAFFVGTHIGEFSGVGATGKSVDRTAQPSSTVVSSLWVPGRGAHGSSLAGRTTISRSPRASWVTTGSKYR